MFSVKVGCQLSYTTSAPTSAVFMVQPPPHTRHMLSREEFQTVTASVTSEFCDAFANRCQRVLLQPGENVIRYDALVTVSPEPDVIRPNARFVPPQELSPELLRYTLPSRYVETDELLNFAWENFGKVPAGWERARAICDWVHKHIEYRLGSSFPDWSAADTILRRHGVCRDMAHVIIALSRAFNMPARYSVAYLPDIGVADDGTPMDFHAYAEVWLEGGWQVFDARYNLPRKGRIFIASGLDATDTAFATIYGAARLTRFQVWADPVNERGEKINLALPKAESPAPGGVQLHLNPPSAPRRVEAGGGALN
jgi:transglutaminase-like putative cysteine protease